ncbi:Glucans biosynthesis protein G precursor [Oxalobacteraceae bacterium IMCC9480]|nr:Glucans biosynthesis protein G precursor [Oxalobacteraceae bacterium IMCC9480]NDP60234.1 glucan biosynthesis protein G [Oxalobacteraceae bacterium]
MHSTIPRLLSSSRWNLLAVLLATCAALAGNSAFAFDFADVAQRAKVLSQSAYKKPAGNLPKSIDNLSYDQYRDIRFNTDKSLWRSARLPFEVAFFHQGLFYDHPVKINEVINKRVREIKFDPQSFNYGKNAIDPKQLEQLGFAGFRVHTALNSKKYKDEVVVFLGASYFRALGKGQGYGASARGLSIDTAQNSGEEFPQFSEFWLDRPDGNAKELTIYALLDSRRATGAYRFTIKPGSDTEVDVKAQLFLRENVATLGIAPLTSMYFFGENQRSTVEDYRPEVHDSDGLSVQTGSDEWIWRPLVNPKRLLVTSFALENPKGFGLMQRERNFSSFQDLESHYEKRPSVWIEPTGKWGKGRIELVQLPTADETNDNAVAFWTPEQNPKPGQPFNVEYKMRWEKESETRPPHAWVTQTRRGHGYTKKVDESLALIIDFEGPAFKKLPAETKLEGAVTIDANGKLMETNTYRNEVTGGWRIAVRLDRNDDAKPVELTAHLRNGKEVLSETWSYILPPN